MDEQRDVLFAILSTVARQAFSADRVIEIVTNGGGEKQLQAYNLCDGTNAQKDICKATGLDPGNLSRSISRWVDEGIVFKFGKEGMPRHIFPVSEQKAKVRRMANDNADLAAKLDTLIRLQARIAVAGFGSQKEKILFLDGVGMRPSEIASVLGTTSNTVSVALSNERKAAAKGTKKPSKQGGADE